MPRQRSFRDLILWQKAMSLARDTYKLSQEFPKAEAFGLLSQIRRSAVSIPSNIAEGHGRLTDIQFRHFLGNARGSLCELQTQLELAHSLGYLNERSWSQLAARGDEVARLLNGLISALSGRRTNSASSANTASSATS